MTRRTPCIAAALMLASGIAAASWSEPSDDYVSRYRTDIALDRYQAGQLGVVLPTYIRSNLYTAWRDVMLGAPGLQSAPNRAAGLAAVERTRKGGWQDLGAGRGAYDGWRAAVRQALKRDMDPPRDADKLVDSYLNCPVASYVFASATLGDLAARADATPERMAAWVSNPAPGVQGLRRRSAGGRLSVPAREKSARAARVAGRGRTAALAPGARVPAGVIRFLRRGLCAQHGAVRPHRRHGWPPAARLGRLSGAARPGPRRAVRARHPGRTMASPRRPGQGRPGGSRRPSAGAAEKTAGHRSAGCAHSGQSGAGGAPRRQPRHRPGHAGRPDTRRALCPTGPAAR